MKHNKAITLLELLIASTIFVIVITTVYSAYQSGIFGYRNIEENINSYQVVRLILERLNLDLRNSFVFSNNTTKLEGSSDEIKFLTLVDGFSEDNIIQDYAWVSYNLDGDKILRLCRKNREALNGNSEIKPQQMAANVKMSFKYGYLPTGRQKIEFKDSWAIDSPQEQGKLPLAIKVSLSIEGKTRQDFQRTIFLPLAE